MLLASSFMLYEASHLSEMRIGLGSSLFTRRYLGNKNLFLLLRLLRCFTSAGTLSRHL